MLGRMKLHVRAAPNAHRSEVIGWENDARSGRVLRVRVAAPPVEGKANAALRDFLARTLDLPRSQVVLDRGNASRLKCFEIPDGTPLP